MADEQFHFAINKWDVTKNYNNKNKKQEETKNWAYVIIHSRTAQVV